MIVNRQRGVRVSLRGLKGFAISASELLRLPEESLTVCLVTNAEIARWNRAYRGKPEPTDVLSFPVRAGRGRFAPKKRGKGTASRASKTAVASSDAAFDSADSLDSRAGSVYLGDIAIAPRVARRNAARLGRTFESEMRILILHGMLHLMGYDHETDTGQMDRRERRLRRALGLA